MRQEVEMFEIAIEGSKNEIIRLLKANLNDWLRPPTITAIRSLIEAIEGAESNIEVLREFEKKQHAKIDRVKLGVASTLVLKRAREWYEERSKRIRAGGGRNIMGEIVWDNREEKNLFDACEEEDKQRRGLEVPAAKKKTRANKTGKKRRGR